MTQPWGPVAMIGTRSLDAVPKAVVQAFQRIAQAIGRSNGVVRTGAAKGADQMAAEACLKAGGYVRLVLPWVSYEETWRQQIHRAYPDRVFETVYQPDRHPEWAESVRMHHPAPERLTRGAFALHARNYGIIVGARTPALAVIAVPRSLQPDQEGGTGQGLRIARAHKIPALNLLPIYHEAAEGADGIKAIYRAVAQTLPELTSATLAEWKGEHLLPPDPGERKPTRLKVYTASIRLEELKKDPAWLDITIKSSKGIGRAFAPPTWDIVIGHKRGAISDAQYIEGYLPAMRESYRQNHQAWQAVLARERVILTCYCPPGARFCHRYLAAEILEHLGAEVAGEILPGGKVVPIPRMLGPYLQG